MEPTDHKCPKCSHDIVWWLDGDDTIPYIGGAPADACRRKYPYVSCICGYSDCLEEPNNSQPVTVVLEHKFKDYCDDLDFLISRTSLDEFIKALMTKANQISDENVRTKYLGDGFELFCEFFIKFHGNSIGISGYKVVQTGDYGVDGYGKGNHGQPVAVQCKFRSNPRHLLDNNRDHISNFFEDAVKNYDVNPHGKGDMFVLTTGDGLNPVLKENLHHDCIRCFGRKMIDRLARDFLFWQSFKASVESSVTQTENHTPVRLRDHQLGAVEAAMRMMET